MNFTDYQNECKQTAVYPNVGSNWQYPLLGLAGEVGEACNIGQKIIRDSDGKLDEGYLNRFNEELGGVLWFLATLCTELNISFDLLAEANLEKLRSRKERGRLSGSGDNR